MIYTVFYKDDAMMPQDYSTYAEAEEAAQEFVRNGLADDYVIESTDGEVI